MTKRWFLPISLLAMLLAQCLYFAWDTGQTVDETFYNGSGYPIVRYNDYRIMGEHPPLTMQLASIPLLFLQPKYPFDQPISLATDPDLFDVSKMGSRFLYEMGNNAHLILFLERTSIILLTVLLGWALYKWAFELYGWSGAVLSLTLFTFSPTVISNGSQYMTDMTLTVFFFLTVYMLNIFFDKPTPKSALCVGICTGLALMSKMSAIILFPVVLILFLTYFFITKSCRITILNISNRFDGLLIVLSVVLFILSLYEKIVFVALAPLSVTSVSILITKGRFNQKLIIRILLFGIWSALFIVGGIFTWMIEGKRPFLIALAGAVWLILVGLFNWVITHTKQGPKTYHLTKYFCFIWFAASIVIIVGYTDFFLTLSNGVGVFSHYVRAFNIASNHSLAGHVNCIQGSFVTCDWRFFMASMAIKTPISTLLFFVIGLFFFVRGKFSTLTKVLVLVSSGFFFVFASAVNQIFIGIRHILPVYPFIFLIAGAMMRPILEMSHLLSRRILLFLFSALIVLLVERTLVTTPHHMSYFNEIIGTAEQGVNLMRVNAGQDNKRLAELVKREGISSIKIFTSNNNPAEFDYYQMPWSYMDKGDLQKPSAGFYAIDLEFYHNLQKDEKSWFYKRKPTYRVGETIYIFYVTNTNAAALIKD